MRSWIALGVGCALFAGFLVRAHLRARSMLRTEAVAIKRLCEFAVDADRAPRKEGGYRYRWELGQNLPALLLAGPLRPGEDGARWFATHNGEQIWEFDTVLFRTRREEPDTAELRRFLAAKEAKRKELPPPYGWRLVQRPTMSR